MDQKMKNVMILLCMLMLSVNALAEDTSVAEIIAGPHRTEAFAERDRYRHPQQALEFFNIRPDIAVGEIWPGGGWWAEIFAPYLKDSGKYYAVGFSLTAKRTPNWRRNMAKELIAKFEADPDIYGNSIVTSLSVPEDTLIAPAESLDLVLTFRNVHNWVKGEYAEGVFSAMYSALKPGGVLGVVEHRAPPDFSLEYMKLSGYVTEAHVKELAANAGFEFVEGSEINANPADTKDHPAGVWTLPPSLRQCGQLDDAAEAATCNQHYRDIGESDRMTLKFIKPGQD
jgi:predicted methyltransferase